MEEGDGRGVQLLDALYALVMPRQALPQYKVCWHVRCDNEKELIVSIRVEVALGATTLSAQVNDRIEHMRLVVAVATKAERPGLEPLNSANRLYAKLDNRPEVRADTSGLERPPLGGGVELAQHQKRSLLFMRAQEERNEPPLWQRTPSGVWLHAMGLVSEAHPCPDLRGVGLLSDEPGLGKTMTVLALLCMEKKEHPERMGDQPPPVPVPDGSTPRRTLIVVPPELVAQWKEQLRLYAPVLKVAVLEELSRALKKGQVHHAIAGYDVVLTTPNVLKANFSTKRDPSGSTFFGKKPAKKHRHHATAAQEASWWRIVLDESHKVRNSETQIAEACIRLSAPNRWLLSGTPIISEVSSDKFSSDMQTSFAFLKLAPFKDKKVWSHLMPDEDEARNQFFYSLLSKTMMRHDKRDLIKEGGALRPPVMRIHAITPRDDEKYLIGFCEAKSCEVLQMEERMKQMVSSLERSSMYRNMKLVCAAGEEAQLELLNRMCGDLYSAANFEMPADVRAQRVWRLPFERAVHELHVARGGGHMGGEGLEAIFAQPVPHRSIYEGGNATRREHLYQEYEEGGNTLTELFQIGRQGDTNGVTCSICQRQVRRPTFTRCKHCFCRDCIVAHVESEQGSGGERNGSCPVCRGPVGFGNGQIIEVQLRGNADAQPAVAGAASSSAHPQQPQLAQDELAQEWIPACGEEDLERIPLPSEANEYDPETSAMYPHVPPAAMWAYDQLVGQPSSKIKEVGRLLRRIRRADDTAKCLVFSHEIKVLDRLRDYLPIDDGDLIQLDGRRDPHARSEDQRRFQLPDGPWLCVCTPLVSGVGINLHAANHILLMDPFDVEAAETQAIARLLRMGQMKQVEVTQLFVRGSIEERILQLRDQQTKEAEFSFGGTINDGGGSKEHDKFIFGIEDNRA